MERFRRLGKGLHYIALVATIFVAVSSTYAASTSLVSITKEGIQGNWWSLYPAISADGRYVAFGSIASNFAPDDTNGREDVFVVDRTTGDIKRVSVSSSGVQGNGNSSGKAAISADGRYIAFGSEANNLVPGDDNNAPDVFVHDQTTGITERVSNGARPATYTIAMSSDGRFISFQSANYDLIVYDRQAGTSKIASVNNDNTRMTYGGSNPAMSSDGRFIAFQGAANDFNPYTYALYVRDLIGLTTQQVRVFSAGVSFLNISDDGRYLAFSSSDSTIIPDDTNGYYDVYVLDRADGTIERVSVSSSGVQGNGASSESSMSADGRYITFFSTSNNLVPGDNNASEDIFLHDRVTKITELISISSNGVQGNYRSGLPAISMDGRYVAFYSFSDNLVPCDANSWQDIFVYDRSGTPADYNGCGPRNRPPVANAGSDLIVSCASPSVTPVTLDGSGSSDPDNDPITYSWSWTGGSASGVKPTISLPPGTTTITLIVNDGNVDGVPATVKVTVQDTMPPVTILRSIEGIAGNNGWYTSGVTVTLDTTDNCSSVKEIRYNIDGAETVVTGSTASFMVSPEGAHSVSYFARDNVGNSETAHVLGVNIDKTPPAIVASAAPAPNGAGWNNGDVAVAFTCSDALSGIASCPAPITVKADGSGQVITGVAIDKAGHTAAASVTVNIDKTPPVITATAGPAPNSYGWNNTAVTVTFLCNDAVSGVVSCPPPVTVPTEGANQVVTGTAVDRAGNSATAAVSLAIDKTPPVVTLSATPNRLRSSGSHKMVPVTIGGGASDSLSSIASTLFSVVDEYGTVQPAVSGFNTTIALEAWRNPKDRNGRTYTITVVVTDKAGNKTTKSATVIVQ
jgi:dipeptidyl aminopeptidase/acylaminoacyl peptidase